MKIKNISILGSTGSIGSQTLDVIRKNPNLYRVEGLTVNKSINQLLDQINEFKPKSVAIFDDTAYEEFLTLVEEKVATSPYLAKINVYKGHEGLIKIAGSRTIDILVTAVVGMIGLLPTVEAIKNSTTIALANKETLVVAGELICRLAQEYHVPIIPVDSEHSAIFQCLTGEGDSGIDKILLTASGGPFRLFTKEQMSRVTAADALKHPTWEMGAKITIDSASMMNKGFEVIEAKWLFGVPVKRIQVLVHPQSIVHSAVQFCDGSVKAQLGMPDMRLPIQYAFSFPDRLPLDGQRLNLFRQPLEFFEPDLDKFRCLALAFEAIHRGGNMPCILNAANEIVNEAFRQARCSFIAMADIIEKAMERSAFDANPTYETYIQTDQEARRIAREMVG